MADFFSHMQQQSSDENPALEVRERQFGYAKKIFVMSSDFDEPLDDFKDSM